MIKKDYLDNFNIEIFGAEKISRDISSVQRHELPIILKAL